ncbi:MAG: hypothetical protein MMC33_002460 [Icmadophila ericetorum]|nr:hypothetical protein [Icmadophila ericetorum]
MSYPVFIEPPGGIPSQPANTTLIQVGFQYSLNWPFVSGNTAASNEIFQYLPIGIAYGLGINVDQVTMYLLEEDNTEASLGYITTVALAYIPSTLVTTLATDVNTPTSQLYNNPNSNVKEIVSFINPGVVPITP